MKPPWVKLDEITYLRQGFAVARHFDAAKGWFVASIFFGTVEGYDSAEDAMAAADSLAEAL